MTIPDETLAQWQELADGATGGPWIWSGHPVPEMSGRCGTGDYSWAQPVIEASHEGECGCRAACELALEVGLADRAFISAARTAVPALLAEVARLRAMLPDPATHDALLHRIAIAMWDADDAARIADGEADMIMPRDNRQVMSEYLGHASAALTVIRTSNRPDPATHTHDGIRRDKTIPVRYGYRDVGI